tara:strand:- start:910 stop:1668 length:759 start_codon:yes stop_codon:yes gene_type:complete
MIYKTKTNERTVELTINRPKVLNALDRETRNELLKALKEIRLDPSVHVVVITGEGNKSFCSGVDIKEISRLSDSEINELVSMEHEFLKYVRNYPKPVIAKINGYALGSGLLLVMVADFSISKSDAIFGMPEVSRGAAAGYETALLLNYIGLAKTRALTILGQKISGIEAESWGLISHSVDYNILDDATNKLAKRLSEMNPNAIVCQKKLINSWIENGPFEFVNDGINEICEIIIKNKHYKSKKANLISNIFS